MFFYADSLSLFHSDRFDSILLCVTISLLFFCYSRSVSLSISSEPGHISLCSVLYSLESSVVAVWIVATVKMKTHKLFLVSTIFIYTNGDEPPHFNLRFTAPDYNNTPTQIKCNNCCLIFFSYLLFLFLVLLFVPFLLYHFCCCI